MLAKDAGWPGFAGLLNIEAVLGTLFWYGLSLVLNAILPATEVEGTELRTGGKLKYRLNGEQDLGMRNTMADCGKRFILL